MAGVGGGVVEGAVLGRPGGLCRCCWWCGWSPNREGESECSAVNRRGDVLCTLLRTLPWSSCPF